MTRKGGDDIYKKKSTWTGKMVIGLAGGSYVYSCYLACHSTCELSIAQLVKFLVVEYFPRCECLNSVQVILFSRIYFCASALSIVKRL